MNELIGIAALIATLYGGTLAAERIYCAVRTAALTKAAEGLPRLAPFAAALTKQQRPAPTHNSKGGAKGQTPRSPKKEVKAP